MTQVAGSARHDQRAWLVRCGIAGIGLLLGFLATTPLWLYSRLLLGPPLRSPGDEGEGVLIGWAVLVMTCLLVVVLGLLVGMGFFAVLVLRLPALVALPLLLVAFALPALLSTLHPFGWVPVRP